MKKKLLAMLCVLSILVGVFALSVTAESTTTESTTTEKFYVGYAKVDINPYVTEGNSTSGIMPVPLRGTGDTYTRRATSGKIDDNGDGVVDGNDGLFLTCIAISNSPDSYDDAILLFTMDAIGDMGHTKLARQTIQAELGIAGDHVMVSGTHAHSGVNLEALNKTLYNTDVDAHEYLNIWRTRLTGYRKNVEVSGQNADGTYIFTTYTDEYTNTNNYFVQAAQAALSDRAEATISKGQIEVDESGITNADNMNFVRNYVSQASDGTHFVKDAHFNKSVEDSELQGHVSDADQTLHAITFNFDDSTKDPILLVNWRNHPQFASSYDNFAVSSDYINAFRYQMGLEANGGYRAAFFQGTGGNTQPYGNMSGEGWAKNDQLEDVHNYGKLLADATKVCLSSDSMHQVAGGEIQTLQNIYKAERVTFPNTLDIPAVVEAANEANSWPYQYTYTDENGVVQTDWIINSNHAARILTHYNNQSLETINLEIDTIMIGPEIAIVTCPGEPFDRYSQEAADIIKDKWDNGETVTYSDYTDAANAYNDWEKLNTYNGETELGIKNAQYGEPLIFGYTNQHVTYIPNALTYHYNTNLSATYATQSYENYMTPLAEGEGEQMVANLATMLNDMVNSEVRHCEACGKSVTWYDLSLGISSEYDHYYLSGDTTVTQQTISANTVCVDLRGYTLSNSDATSSARVFNVTGGALNILDTSENKTGKVKGSCVGGSGGAINVASATNETGTVVEGTVNIYGGEISNTEKAAFGGVVYMGANSTVNIYGGKIKGGEANRFGGAICVAEATSKLNVYGGEITAGTAGGYSENDAAKGHCVAFRNGIGEVTVGGDAKIDEIAYIVNQSSKAVSVQPTEETFKIVDSPADSDTQTPFAGSVVLNANCITNGAIVGSVSVPWVKGASVTISSGYDVEMNKDGQLVAVTAVGGAAGVVDQNEDITLYGTLAEAIAKVGEGYVILGADVDELTVSSDITVDLNGKKVTNATATNGATLTLMDRKTGDYCIGDHIYGIVEKISGNVVAADHYVAVTDDEGTSYHGYDMKLVSVTLRPGKNGMFYSSEFLGDAMVASQIECFGTALRIGKAPDAGSMNPGTYSAFAPEDFGGKSNSTILVDIMKSSNIVSTNQNNASLNVYGRSYIKWNDGSYEFTDVDEDQVYSLRTLMEEISETYTVDVLKENADLMEMYRRFSAAMSGWDIQNIRDAYAANQKAEDEVLKVLVLGNSHSQDSFFHLTKVIETEGIPATAKYNDTAITGVEVGVMYKSGCYMYQHASNAKNNTAAYTYHKFSYADGKAARRVDTPKTTLETALTDEKWDIVVLQEMNMYDGIGNDYHGPDTQYMYEYIKSILGYTPKFMWNMVWANPELVAIDGEITTGEEWLYVSDPGIESWERRMNNLYSNDGQTQHNKMVSYVDKYIVGRYGIYEENVVSPGTAVMYALNECTLATPTGTDSLYRANEKVMYRDYTHLSDPARVMASYLWYAKLFDLEQIDNVNYTTIPYVWQQLNDNNADATEADGNPMDISAHTAWIKAAVNATLSDRHCAYTGQ